MSGIQNEEKKTYIARIQNKQFIPGVLFLDTNKTYGKIKNKLLYKCIPNDKELPIFLVSYEINPPKNTFYKKNKNIFVTIEFVSWNDKHPLGCVTNNLGEVGILSNFYMYELYCKNLVISIQPFTKYTYLQVKEKGLENEKNMTESFLRSCPTLKNRTNQSEWNIFTIDPIGSHDFDDAFSIQQEINGNVIISIYISNVPMWMDMLDSWNFLSEKVSTIYLPENMKKPMMPSLLSDKLCSLQKNMNRIAFVMDVSINQNNEIVDIHYENAIIRVSENYSYDDSELLKNKKYMDLYEVCKNISTAFFTFSNFSLFDSHTLVEYLMILMNYHSSKIMIKYKNGICRSLITENIGKKVIDSKGEYKNIRSIENVSDMRHDTLGLESYIHITSPIRRIVDVMNMLQIQKNLGLHYFSENANTFYEKWIQKIEYINSSVVAIKKVQNTCFLLDLVCNNAEVLSKSHNGYVVEIMEHNKYVIYLPELKFFSTVITENDLNMEDIYYFKLFVFHNESTCKKKIRLHFI